MTLRHAAAIAAALLTAAATIAQDATAPKSKSAAPAQPTLKVGDKAPPLAISKWVKGEPVTGFEKGKTYVVEFWATWCGPCIQSMPHLSAIQKEFGGRVTVIGLTSKDSRGNTLEKVEKMVADKAEVMAYTVAFDDERKTNDAYMKAADQRFIPTSFVIDPAGKVAYIGSPMWLDKPLHEITKGTWDPEKGMADAKEGETRLNTLFRAGAQDPKAALEEWADFEKDYPALGAMFEDTRYTLMLKAGDPRAEEVGRKLVDDAIRTKNIGTIYTIASAQEPEAAIKTIERFEQANPDAAASLADLKYGLLVKAGDPRAPEVGRTLVDEAVRTRNSAKIYMIASAQEPKEGLATIDKFRAANPDHPAPGLDLLKYQFLVKSGNPKAAAPIANTIIDNAAKPEDASTLNEIAWSIVDPDAAVPQRDLDLALRAATKAVQLSKEKEASILDTLARVYFWQGDLPKAIEWQKKAVAQAQDAMRPELEATLKEYEDKAKK